MEVNIEDGGAPLARQTSAGRALQTACARFAWLQLVTMVVAAADLVISVVVLLSPFSFDFEDMAESQVAHWSVSGSVADWTLLAILRDVAMIGALMWARCKKNEERGAQWARRAVVFTALLIIFRLTCLDWSGPRAAAILAPTVVVWCLFAPLLALLAQLLFWTGAKIEKLRTTLNEDEQQPEEDEQYSSALTFVQTLRVLKPYFWPSTGKPTVVLMNRIRAVSTWLCVAISKISNIIAPMFLAAATNYVKTQIDLKSTVMTSEIVWNLGMYGFMVFLSKIFKEAQSLVYIKVQQAAYIEIADFTFGHLHNLSLDWHLRKKMGNVIRSMDRGIDAAQKTMQYVFLYLFPTLAEAFAVVLIFVFHYKDTRLAAFVFLNLFAYIYVTVKITLWRKKFRTATTKHDNTLHDRLTDSLVNYETIKYFTAEDYERRQYRDAVEQYQKMSMATQASLSFLNCMQQAIVNFCLAGGMVLAVYSVLADGNLGDFVAVNVYLLNIFTPLGFLGTIYNMVVNAVVDMHSFGQLLAEKTDVQDISGAVPLSLAQNQGNQAMVEFKEVCFSYSKQPQGRSVKDVSFSLPRGGTLALVGPTGAGKTTITRLLFRFYDTIAGQVLINGQNIKNVTQRSLRAAIGMVPQDVVLFNSTISHNLRYGRISDEEVTQEQIEVAAKSAQLHGFVEQQPKGYDTMVGERGLKLSGGEKQRLAIARCLVKNPPIVVLDEATSALDSQTEQKVQQALEVLSQARTVIAIAHRLSTIRHYDQIIVLEDGQVTENGSHNELLEREGSKYAAMWNRQAAGIMDDAGTGASEGASPGASTAGSTATTNGGGLQMRQGKPAESDGHGGGAGHGRGHGHGHGH
eukprot:TRINITY_DN14690_c0_g1_i1.p1 TRINITY_DN14690_c0_g1~~TRINITY_DN14690_c0_g1_i1.p1  ORF type:complete len:855 (-),score=217.69 TRINITY_DN14690_c0_g1_i1:194-2758(-)